MARVCALLLLQRGSELLRAGDALHEPQLLLARLVVNDKGWHRVYIQTVREGASDGCMLAEPHDVRSLAEFSLNPIDRGACREAFRSVVGEQDDNDRRALTDEPIQCRGVGEVRFTIAQERRHGDETKANQRYKRQASSLRQPKVSCHRAGRENKDYE